MEASSLSFSATFSPESSATDLNREELTRADHVLRSAPLTLPYFRARKYEMREK